MTTEHPYNSVGTEYRAKLRLIKAWRRMNNTTLKHFNLIFYGRGLHSRSCFWVPNFFPENPGNFTSCAFKTSHFLSCLIPAHSRLVTSRPVSVLKMKLEFPNLKFCISIPEIHTCSQKCFSLFSVGAFFKCCCLNLSKSSAVNKSQQTVFKKQRWCHLVEKCCDRCRWLEKCSHWHYWFIFVQVDIKKRHHPNTAKLLFVLSGNWTIFSFSEFSTLK